MLSIAEHQEMPKGEAAVMPVGSLSKPRRDRNLAARGRGQPKGRTTFKLMLTHGLLQFPRSTVLPGMLTSVEEYIAFFQSLGSKFLTDGDWSAKYKEWGARFITLKGRNF
jgi:hypothetical protein